MEDQLIDKNGNFIYTDHTKLFGISFFLSNINKNSS